MSAADPIKKNTNGHSKRRRISKLSYKRPSEFDFPFQHKEELRACSVSKMKQVNQKGPLERDWLPFSEGLFLWHLLEVHAPILSLWGVKIVVISLFLGCALASIALCTRIEPGLEQKIVLPRDSYLQGEKDQILDGQNEWRWRERFSNYKTPWSNYRGILACLDGYMNIAMEQAEEYVNGQLKNKYDNAFISGNNVLYISTSKRTLADGA